ncbi:Uncharacterized protein ALO94_00210 [Pseudomonas syringae pv. spinaceae]|uniref:Uncharacterized protein n=1 Tax=Pseudomonas syringae pv. spinaceae TaxID=264459 RepID=A0A0Q0FWP9_PSESX|nr:Uncharacterized protein ALO94_00210 [Pseudomonas syringae pv. spinaceae]
MLLWFLEDFCRPPVFLSGRLFLFLVGGIYITLTLVAIGTALSFQILYDRVFGTSCEAGTVPLLKCVRISSLRSVPDQIDSSPDLRNVSQGRTPFPLILSSLFSARDALIMWVIKQQACTKFLEMKKFCEKSEFALRFDHN